MAEPDHRRVGLGCEIECRVGRGSARTGSIGTTFGIPLHTRRVRVVDDVDVEVGPARIVALVGPSGSGKSSALDAAARAFPLACLVQHVGFPEGAAIVDRVAVGEPLPTAIALLTSCGLGDANLWVRPFAALSEGERFRARLARATRSRRRTGGSDPWSATSSARASIARRPVRSVSTSANWSRAASSV